MKIAAGIIVFNSDFVLKQVLESIYPYMNQILVSEGCVKYWADKGFTTSTDKTNDILKNFPDPDKKITVVHGIYKEKTEQANAYMEYVDPATSYVWNIDADEVFKSQDIEKVIELLKNGDYTSAGFQSCTFYGGFDRKLTGFEEDCEFVRIQRYHPGAEWENHRPPTISLPNGYTRKHLSFKTLAEKGIYMYHYSYVFPRQVRQKIAYYEAAVIAEGKCIPKYYENVYLAWVNGNDKERQEIEEEYLGVHEFLPVLARGECFTEPFIGEHPPIIKRDMKKLNKEIINQLREKHGQRI